MRRYGSGYLKSLQDSIGWLTFRLTHCLSYPQNEFSFLFCECLFFVCTHFFSWSVYVCGLIWLCVCVCVQLHLLLLHLCSFERVCVSVFKCVQFFVNLLLVCVCLCVCVCVCVYVSKTCLFITSRPRGNPIAWFTTGFSHESVKKLSVITREQGS
jgi:hypothetical protein